MWNQQKNKLKRQLIVKVKTLLLIGFISLSLGIFAQEKVWLKKMKAFYGEVNVKKSKAKATNVKIESISFYPIEVLASLKNQQNKSLSL